MIKELIGAGCTLFIMLPFLLLNSRILKMNNIKRIAFFLLITNVMQIAILVFLAYCLYYIGQSSLIGMVVVFSIYLFIFLVIWFSKKKPAISNEDEPEDDLYRTQKIKRNGSIKKNDNELKEAVEADSQQEEPKILEDDQYTIGVEEPDFSTIDQKKIKKTLEDIFKEN